MSFNREKYDLALHALYECANNCDVAYVGSKNSKCNREYYMLDKLINEKFDNPPLKLEELEDGEWYWCEEYGWCLMNFYEDLDGKIHFEANTVMNDKIDLSFDFEENRFYRKQVKDDG